MLKITPEQAEESRRKLHEFRQNSIERHYNELRLKKNYAQTETIQFLNGTQITVKLRD